MICETDVDDVVAAIEMDGKHKLAAKAAPNAVAYTFPFFTENTSSLFATVSHRINMIHSNVDINNLTTKICV